MVSPSSSDNNDTNIVYDVCIVGAGPAGLATLSALHSPFTLDGGTLTDIQKERAQRQFSKNHQSLNVCVVDSHNQWMQEWQDNFEQLDIQYLRSPTLAHPDLFDQHALLGYAVRNNREHELLESGCFDIKSLLALGQSQIGLWKLPSTRLFVDYCLELSQSRDLPHTFRGNSTLIEIQKSSHFQLTIETQTEVGPRRSMVTAKAVVLALGPAGRPIVPNFLRQPSAPRWRLWNQPEFTNESQLPLLVIGGGLTAVQVALKEVAQRRQKGILGNGQPSVVLVSKRPLAEKHFDINVEWFDMRKTNKCMADFYHLPMEERKRALGEARRGGSVPPMYMKEVEAAELEGYLQCLVGEVDLDGENSDTEPGASRRICIRHAPSDPGVSSSFWVQDVVVACGVEPICGQTEDTSLTSQIQSEWKTQMAGGLPCVTQDLRWKEGLDLFVVGSLGALNIGPDAGNLMGIRRAAQLVANALGCRRWLRETVLVNPFEALGWSDSSDEESDFSDEESKADFCCSDTSSTTDQESDLECSSCNSGWSPDQEIN